MPTPQVDFYIVHDGHRDACEHVACRIAEKAWQRGHRVMLRADTADDATRLDQLLWVFRQDAFLPHALLARADANDPIVIGTPDDAAPPDCDVLINLSTASPALSDNWRRIAEIASEQVPDALQAARQRFRWYRKQGIHPTSHTIGKTTG